MSTAPIEVDMGPTCLRVAAVQMIFADSLSGNLEKIELAATRAAEAGVDVVLFPECATTGYAYDFATLKPAELRRALRAVATIAAKQHVHLLVGSPIFAGRRLYNGLVVFDRRGRLVHTYAKCQLTDADRSWFTPGNGLSLFSLDSVRATAIICHERRYPELVRLAVMAGAQVVFHPNAGMDTPGGVASEAARARRNGRAGVRERDLLRVRQFGRPPRRRQVVSGRLENRRPRRLLPAACRQPPGNDHRQRVGFIAGHAQVRSREPTAPPGPGGPLASHAA